MLVLRLQRVGRRGHATYRLLVQDSRWSPKAGKFIAHLGSYDPHNKKLIVDRQKAELYLKNGAQPSEKLAILLKKEGVALPKWVPEPRKRSGKTKKAEVPAAAKPTVPESPADEAPSEEKPADATIDQPAEVAEETKPEEVIAEPVAETIEPTPAETEKPAEAEPEAIAEDKPAVKKA